MPDGTRIRINLVVVTTLRNDQPLAITAQRDLAHFIRFVAEEVDFLELLVCDMLQAVGLIPTGWEYVE